MSCILKTDFENRDWVAAALPADAFSTTSESFCFYGLIPLQTFDILSILKGKLTLLFVSPRVAFLSTEENAEY